MMQAEDRIAERLSLPSERGRDRDAALHMVRLAEQLGLDPRLGARIATAVAEATLNAMEHGHHFDPRLPVVIGWAVERQSLCVQVSALDDGPAELAVEEPNLPAKLEGTQTLRGWGNLLIEQMADEVLVVRDATHRTVEMRWRIGGTA